MPQLQTRSGLGIALAMIGGLMISIDIPLIRLALSDPWLVMVARGAGLACVLGVVLMFGRNLTQTPHHPFADRDWVMVGSLYGLASIFFTFAVFTTSTANLVFILAFNPMIAAVLSWWLIGEKPKLVTWLAIGLTFTGVLVIVSDGVSGGTLSGDLAALVTAATLALAIVLARKSGKDLSLSPVFGGLVSGIFALPLALLYSSWPGAINWLLLDAFVLIPIAGFCLSAAPRFIPAPHVAMFFVLETVLAPVWVWLIFSDVPGERTLIGGAIVMAAIIGHSAWQLRGGTRLKAVTG